MSQQSTLQKQKIQIPTKQHGDVSFTRTTPWYSSISNFIKKFSFVSELQKPQNLKAPPPFNKYHKEIKKTFIIPSQDIHTGFTLTRHGIISHSPFHQSVVAHQAILGADAGGGATVNNYSFILQYHTPKGMIFSRIDNNQTIFCGMDLKFLPKKNLEVGLQYQGMKRDIILKGQYRGPDYHLRAKLKKDKEANVSYMQQITPRLALGVQLKYDAKTRDSFLSYVGRYKKQDTIVAGKLDSKKKMFRLSYLQAVDYAVDMVAELTYDWEKRKAGYKYGFEQEFINGNYKCTINQDGAFQAAFEQRIQNIQVTASVQVDPTKKKQQPMMAMFGMPQGTITTTPEVKIGLNISIEDQ